MKITKLMALFLCFSAFTFSLPVRAQGTAVSEVNAIYDAYLKTNEFSSADRERFVLAISQYCQYLDLIFPKNSPDDSKWLSEELKGSLERSLKAAESVQSARQNVEFLTYQCKVSSTDFSLKEAKEKTSSLIFLSYAFSTFNHKYPKPNRIEALTGISSEKTGFLLIGDLINKLILSAALEHAGCDTKEKHCTTSD